MNIFQQANHSRLSPCGFWVHKLHTGAKIHEMHQKYIKGHCVGTAAKRLLRRETREARGERQMASSTVSTLRQAGRPAGREKCRTSPYKWHPERLVSSRTTLIPLLGLYIESLTPTYTVNGKVTFEKWGPHRDLIHWLTLGRGAFPPGRLCDLDWDYTSVWIFSLSPPLRSQRYTLQCRRTHTHRLRQIPFQFHHWM